MQMRKSTEMKTMEVLKILTTELTELEQLLAVEMAMVGVMASLIARNEGEMRY
jgi:hypothetical protein